MIKEKVLVIDDDATVLNSLKTFIAKTGYATLTAENGAKGLAIFEKEKPEIVVSDIKMPDMDGFEVLRRIKKISSTVEVILITGYGNYDLAIQSLQEGASDYLEKPIDFHQLAIALGRCSEKVTQKMELEAKAVVLICEDETMARSKLSSILEKEGYQVFQAENGRSALELFVNNKIDIALVDIKMPGMDGLSVLHELKKKSEDVEVIMMTGYGDETTAIQAMRDGAINYLKKPIDIDQMIIDIQHAMETIRLKRSLLYRKRDQELLHEVIARLSLRQGIIIDLKHSRQQTANKVALDLIDSLPFPICAFNQEGQIVFINQKLKEIFKQAPKKLDEEFIQTLSEIGINKLNIKDFMCALTKLFDKESHYLEIISAGKYAYLIMVKVMALFDAGPTKLVAVGFRGER